MTDWLTGLMILSVIQGVFEFVPVSSSGHMKLMSRALGLELGFNEVGVVLHFGTVCSILVFFWVKVKEVFWVKVKEVFGGRVKEVFGGYREYGLRFWESEVGLIGVGFLSTVVVIWAIGKELERIEDGLFWSGGAYLLNSLILFSPFFFRRRLKRRLKRKLREEGVRSMGLKEAILIGGFQGLSTLPGISRLGVTFVTGIWLLMGKKKSIEYSLFLSLPVVIVGAILEFRVLMGLSGRLGGDWMGLLGGVMVSFLMGYGTLWTLMKFIEAGKFHYFGYYSLGLSIMMMGFKLLGGI